MFDSLSERLSGVLDRLTRRGALTEQDVDAAMREVRRALLEADVAVDVARAFIEQIKKRAVGVDVIKSVTPGQMVVKIVHDELVATLGASAEPTPVREADIAAPTVCGPDDRDLLGARVEQLPQIWARLKRPGHHGA